MKREFRPLKSLLLLVIVFSILLSFSALAVAADTSKDYDAARQYISTYSLYDLPADFTAAKTIPDMLAALTKVDRWARYYDIEAYASYNETYNGAKIGIGIYFKVTDGQVVVMSVVEGSPAYKAGIQAGDIVTKIDGKSLAGMTEEEIAAEFKGEEGSIVILATERNGKIQSYAMSRAAIEIKTVTSSMLEDKVGYILISHFVKNTPAQFKTALTELKIQGATALVLDLRNCPGGMLQSVTNIAGAFLPDGPAVFVRYKDGKESYSRTVNWGMGRIPVAVLVNGNTASGGELLAADIQDARCGVVIGTQTFGKGLVQSVFSLPSGAGLVFTTSKYFSSGLQDIDLNKGVTPDILVADEDRQMAEAKAYLALQQKAGHRLIFSLGSDSVLIDQAADTFKQAPYAADGRSYFPARETLLAMGYEVSYYQGVLYLFKDGLRMALDLSDGALIKGGMSSKFSLQVKNGVLFLPAGFFSSALECSVNWNYKDRTVMIITP